MSDTREQPENESPRKMPTGNHYWLPIGVLCCLFLFIAVFLWFRSYGDSPGPLDADTSVELLVPSGAGLGRIEQILVSKKIIRDDIRFRLLARSMDVAHRLRAGEYRFNGSMTPRQVLNKLAKGDILHHPVTIPEGSNLNQIGDILSREGWVEKEYFLRLSHDPDFISQFSIPAPSLEGYLFPDTYHLFQGQSTEDIIIMMVDRFRQVQQELSDSLLPDSTIPELTSHQQVILASIVEKETGLPEERGKIASVFFNRLKLNMRLQTDPTVIYGLKNFDGNLTRKDLQTPSPYNTYIIKGLPAGPICSPGRAALAAVLQPDQGPFLYFVSRNDGSHYFSKTLTEHNRAVYRFQKK